MAGIGTGTTGAIVQETGTTVLEFSNSAITYADGDIITLVLATGTSIGTASPTCTEQLGEFTVSSCVYTSATNTLVMTISSTNASPDFIFINIDNFIYPTSSLTNWPATGGAGLTLQSSGGTSKGVAFNVKISGVSAGAITSVVIDHDASKPNVGETGATIFFSITVPHVVQTTATMTIFFPTQPVSDIDVVTSPTCTQSGNTMSTSLSCAYSTATQLVTLSSLVDSAASGTFNFTMSGIRNPISTVTVTGILVKTVASDAGNIDTGSGSWSVPNAATITGATWTISGSSVVSVLSGSRVILTLPFPVEANAIIEFTFPTDVTITANLSSYTGVGLFVTGTSFTTKTASVVTVNGVTSDTVSTTTNIITFSQIRNPNKVKSTGTLAINMYTSSNNLIASVSTGLALDATLLKTGSAQIVSITPSSSIVQTSSVTYALIFNPSNFYLTFII
jgi:hypothetical protein